MKILLILAGVAVPAAIAADARAETDVFRKCSACHSVAEPVNRVGPHLSGVVGRPAAAVEDYAGYSKAMKEAGAQGVVWDETTLSAYLAAPKTMIPKTRMAFSGLKSQQEIADVIAYLKANGSR
ncbi:cytochrome c family protein [Shinella daejeonensis]|uniref:c-type cytochrome n=1 Tax=Shinella daejeonensis TaxID=659017 RepID=UPI0020C81C86|nr:cytochrome c family protein [Shinella daejeonensis]MCP8895204.1 cytochrome c family protein [Shinella daejeonensis]